MKIGFILVGMHPFIDAQLAGKAADHLAGADPVLAPVIAAAGLCTIRPHREYYRALVEEIIGQQLSVKAAASIRQRFLDLFGGTFPAPGHILDKSLEELRAVGLSRAKAVYIRDLAEHVENGQVQFDHLDDLTNGQIIAELTAVKGIGEWTAHMFLMFCMGRPDVLAVGDLGIRTGIKNLYHLDHLPTPAEIQVLAKKHKWAPYETFACWYVWRSLNNVPA